MYCKIYILYFFVYIYFILFNSFVKIVNKHTDMQIMQCFECQWGISMIANEEMLPGYADPDAGYPEADSDAT